MKMKFKAAVGSLLVSGVLAGGAVMPAAAGAHGSTGPLCYGYYSSTPMYNFGVNPYYIWGYLAQGEAFRISHTFYNEIEGQWWSLGHSTSSYPADYTVRTNHLRC